MAGVDERRGTPEQRRGGAGGERLVVAHGPPRWAGSQRAAGHLDQPGQRPDRRRHYGDDSRLRLRRGATVTVGGVAATGVVVAGSTSLTAVTGAHATGLADVTVTIPARGRRRSPRASLRPAPDAGGLLHAYACRLVDTCRAGPALAASERRVFAITGRSCGVPATAQAVALNVTVTGATAPGHIRLAPGNGLTDQLHQLLGQARPAPRQRRGHARHGRERRRGRLQQLGRHRPPDPGRQRLLRVGRRAPSGSEVQERRDDDRVREVDEEGSHHRHHEVGAGAGPYFSVSTPMLAMALAVVPSMKPQNPLDITAAS